MTTIPQPQPNFLLGNLTDIDADALVNSLVNLAHNYDGIYKIKLPGREVIVVYSQELVNEVCDEKRFDKKVSRPLEILRDLIGDGLFTAHTQEKNWGKAHRLLMPAFGLTAVRGMFPQMLDIAEQMMLKMERYGEKQVINVSDEMTRLTLDTIALCAFDYRFNSFYTEKMHPFVNAMVESLIESGKKARRLPFQQKLMLAANKKLEDYITFMGTIADDVIAERKTNPSQKKDLLSVMLNSVDSVSGEKLSDENIRYQLLTFLIAGHETTSGLLSFTTYLLLKNPRVLEKLRHEIDIVLGNNEPRVEHITQLRYLEKVLKESLRLYPTASAFAVKAYEDTVIGGQYAVKKDQPIMVLPWMLHRDKKAWGDDVDVFRPERFDPENFAKVPTNSWKPFGNGQRACIGMAFAMQEAILVMAMFFQRFDIIEHDPSYTLKIKETLTIKPDNFYIRTKKRAISIQKTTPPKQASPRGFGITPLSISPILPEKTGIPLLVLYGSNSGSSENFAQQIATNAQNLGFSPKVGVMDDYVNQLPKTGATLIITASYEGQPTHNAKAYVAWLETLDNAALTGVQYAVLGCGHTDWVKTYQAIPIKIDRLMQEKGAEALQQRGEADAANDFMGDFDTWQETTLKMLTKQFGEETDETHVVKDEALIEIEITHNRTNYLQQSELHLCQVIENRELVNMQHPQARSKRHIEILLPEGMTYQAGDYVSMLPFNPKKTIERLLKRFNLAEDTHIIIQKNKDIPYHLPTGHPVWVMDIFTNYIELSQPATKKQVAILAESCPCPPEKAALRRLAETEIYQKDVLSKRLSVLDILEKFKSLEISLAAFIEMLPPLKPRLYSISSSPLWDAKRLTLTVGVVNAPAWSGQGAYKGVASNYLAQLPPDSAVKMRVRPALTAFHLPDNLEQPLIMVCAGTGLAPFRGFIQERAIQKAAGQTIGESLLFFGCDHPEIDYLYRDELSTWQAQGVVKVYMAFSSLPEGDIIFVQHRLWQERAEVTRLLDANAKIYVCGDGKHMAPAVRKTFVAIYQDATNASTEAAEDWVNTIQKDGVRYVTDVFL